MTTGFSPPPLVWETLGELRAVAEQFDGGAVDLTIGSPFDPPPAAVVEALARSGAERGYPPSIGSVAFRQAAAAWMERRLAVRVDPEHIAASVGSKELVAGVPQWLRLRRPDLDTVLYPAISYPTYAMGAELAGCRAVAVPHHTDGRLDLDAIATPDADGALCLWVNSPSNPTGALDDLRAAARWGRDRGVPVLSDECYAEFTWSDRPRTILEDGTDGVLAVHSLSKRSNAAGLRAGFYAGDADLVAYLSQVRKHAGLMVPGPIQAAAVAALADDAHVDLQRERYRHRIRLAVRALRDAGLDATEPGGAFYLWVPVPEGVQDGNALAHWFAREAGTLVTPGGTYGSDGLGHVRLALVQPDEQIEEMASRLRSAATPSDATIDGSPTGKGA